MSFYSVPLSLSIYICTLHFLTILSSHSFILLFSTGHFFLQFLSSLILLKSTLSPIPLLCCLLSSLPFHANFSFFVYFSLLLLFSSLMPLLLLSSFFLSRGLISPSLSRCSDFLSFLFTFNFSIFPSVFPHYKILI